MVLRTVEGTAFVPQVSLTSATRADPAGLDAWRRFSASVDGVLDIVWWAIPEVPVYAYVRFYGVAIYAVMGVRSDRVFQAKEMNAKHLVWPRSPIA